MNEEKTDLLAVKDLEKGLQGSSTISKRKSRNPGAVSLEGLINEVVEAHGRIQTWMKSALRDAIIVGNGLNAIQAYCLPRQFGQCVNENFCMPLGLSMRTAQRYMRLASSYRTLIELLREKARQRGDVILNEEELLDGIPINEALNLIRAAVSAQETDPKSASLEMDSPNKPKLLVNGNSLLVGPNDWFAPPKLVQQVIQVLGAIDLDPCAVSDADPLPAAKRISPPVDSLSTGVAWKGRLFINPGFKGVQPGAWTSKALTCFNSGEVVEAIVLTQAATNTEWARDTNQFPRAFFRSKLTVQAAGEATPRSINIPAMLIFMAKKERFHAFAEAFCDTHDVFFPVQSHRV